MFQDGGYVKVWEIKDTTDKMKRVNMTSSSKRNGEYQKDFSAFVSLVGQAKDFKIEEGGTYKIKHCGCTTYYDSEKKKQYYNFFIFSFDDGKDEQSTTSNTKEKPSKIDPDDLPF